MKIMVRKSDRGFTVYVPKKDLEEPVVGSEKPGLWGGIITLGNGWRLGLPDMPLDVRLPVTVEARKLSEDE
jgi:probable nitrogen fixation protein FixT